jgi:large repetitive protein
MSKTMMRDRVAIGQRWQRRRDRQAGRIRQIHRADRQVELELDGVIALVKFADLRTRWRQLDPILVDATVQDPPPATVSNTATVSGGGSASSSASDGGGANGLADVSITKSAQPGTVASGDQVTYTLNVHNAGPSSAQNVVVSDPLDAGSSRGVTVQTSQGSCDATVSCSLGALAANSTATITITATVIAHDTTLTNTAGVSSSTPDPNAGNNSASASVIVPPSADLTIAKTGTVNPTPGPDSFTLTVSNHGPDTAGGVVVNDSLPSQFTATGAVGGGFTCTLPGGMGGTLVCTRASLAVADGPQQIVVTGTLTTGTEGESPSTWRRSARTRPIPTCPTTPRRSPSSSVRPRMWGSRSWRSRAAARRR